MPQGYSSPMDSRTYRAPRANLTLSDFDIIQLIGNGSFSEVLHVRDRTTGRDYALKIVDKHFIVRNDMIEHVKQERNLLDQCDHPGICRLYFTFQDEANLYFGLELCRNGELFTQIRHASYLSLHRVVFYAAQIVLVLEYLRTQRIVHRDLKPENLLLTDDGHLKLIDFGSAMVLGEHGQQLLKRKSNRRTSLIGTADYLAPEVLNNKPVTYALDLWALGCIIYQMLVGATPFKAASEYLTFQRIVDAKFDYPSSPVPVVPAAAKDLIDGLLQLHPSDRIGAGNLDEVKAHAFFEGVDWGTVYEGPATTFTQPAANESNDVALDWELCSLYARQPIGYQANEGAQVYYTSGDTYDSQGETLPPVCSPAQVPREAEVLDNPRSVETAVSHSTSYCSAGSQQNVAENSSGVQPATISVSEEFIPETPIIHKKQQTEMLRKASEVLALCGVLQAAAF